MEIRNNRTTVYLCNLRVGEVFTFSDTDTYGHDPFLRVNDIRDDDGNIYRAVDLSEGFLTCCGGNEQVIPTKAYLTIE